MVILGDIFNVLLQDVVYAFETESASTKKNCNMKMAQNKVISHEVHV